MSTKFTIRNAQLSLFSQEESCVKSTVNGSVCRDTIAARRNQVNNYLKTREGLWRLLALFPPTTPVAEAIRKAPTLLTHLEKGGLLI